MLGSVFAKSMRDQRRSLLGWGAGLFLLVALTLVTWPTVRDTPGIAELQQNLPPELTAFFGEQSFTTPAGYVNSRVFAILVPLVVLVVAIGRGADSIGGEESRGTLNFLLSLPISRRRVAAEKLLALVAGLALVVAVLFVTLWAGTAAVDMGLAVAGLAAASANALLFALAYATIAFAAAAATGSKGVGVGVASALGLGGYLLNSLAELVDSLDAVRPLSPFYWFLAGDPLQEGLRPASVAVLLGIAAVSAAFAIITFDRRDVGV